LKAGILAICLRWIKPLDKTFGTNLNTLKYQKRFSTPDCLQKPSKEIEDLIPGFQKTKGARAIARNLDLSPKTNYSHSFQIFLKGMHALKKIKICE
jgi:hypothetical protein